MSNHNVPKVNTDKAESDLEKVQIWLNTARDSTGELKAGDWMEKLLPHIKLESANSAQPHPKVVFSYTCKSEHCNRLQNLHGGAAATLFDFCTSMAIVLVSRPGFWQYVGVSRTLNVTYLRPVPIDAETLIECEILQIGKKICALKGVLRRKSDGQLLAVCEHNKVNIDPEESKL
ncbi:Acyl-coenzyme A thioesterase 13 [Cladobotryum mycophilum]|uniref:Acyl-coenzyme A thioesterase 13 n=1 Tax=Cladobotryum mycophilum TaxID=491253 RepID=A0ABR0T2I9_9HYPO